MTPTCAPSYASIVQTLQNQFVVQQVDERVCLVITPSTYPDLAPIELAIYPLPEGSYRITDDGETLSILFLNGLTLTKRLYREIGAIVLAHEVQFAEDEIFAIAPNEAEIGAVVSRLLNATQAIAYLLYKRRHKPSTAFVDVVEEYLIAHGITYRPRYPLQGESKQHTIGFYINSDRNVGIEPLTARTVNAARNKAEKLAFKILDIRNRWREKAPRFVALLDDRGKSGEVWNEQTAIAPLATYADFLIRWSEEKSKPTLPEILRPREG